MFVDIQGVLVEIPRLSEQKSPGSEKTAAIHGQQVAQLLPVVVELEVVSFKMPEPHELGQQAMGLVGEHARTDSFFFEHHLVEKVGERSPRKRSMSSSTRKERSIFSTTSSGAGPLSLMDNSPAAADVLGISGMHVLDGYDVQRKTGQLFRIGL